MVGIKQIEETNDTLSEAEILTTAEKVTRFGFISGASNRMKAPLLPICIMHRRGGIC